MKEKLNIDISQETADNILYEWLTDKEVRKYLNNGVHELSIEFGFSQTFRNFVLLNGKPNFF